MRSLLRSTLLPASILTAALAFSAAPANADVTCTRVAAPNGDDNAAGTPDAPFQTVQQLVDSLRPGDTGCVRAGTYHEQNISIRTSGSSDDNRITLTSYPGERATIDGRIYVTDDSNYLTVENLNLNGAEAPTCTGPSGSCRLPSPTVDGDHVIFQNDDVTNDHNGICFNLGAAGYGRAESDVIRNNRIHDCGKLPADNHEHGIYLAYSDNTQITDNVIYDNADRGIQLYPDAQGTTVRGNIIDGNGEGVIFSGVGGATSNDNVVEHNIITNAKLRYNVESWYPDGLGSGNVARYNCVYGGARGNIASQVGFRASNNLIADPGYADRGAKDFRVTNDACAKILAGGSPPVSASGFTSHPGHPNHTGNGQHGGGGGNGGGHGSAHGASGHPVVLAHAFLRHRRHGDHRWRLSLRGHFGTGGLHRVTIEVRRNGEWEQLDVRNLGRTFRISVDPRIPAVYARVTKAPVRIVAPGLGDSAVVVARNDR